ncbi:MAG: hypothetical protein AVO33_05530 [delta proteobacterium ML8_F1]|nr:MAG: hypothetical protein AVO33_05530 [delta proteobacterium ML8_F1]
MIKKIDERDTMFARMAWSEDGPAAGDYYKRHPEKKTIDDELKALPNLSEEGTATYDPINSRIADSLFRLIADLRPLVDKEVIRGPVEIDPLRATDKLKAIARHFGADLVGITAMKDYHYYSHRGRHEEDYGAPTTPHHRYGIVFAVEMDRDYINRAPQLEQTVETTRGYLNSAMTGMVLSYFLREIGYEARNHMDGNYLVVAPLVAQDAGLGEIGRMGILITKAFGPRVRLGVVTTDLELVPDEPEPFGIKAFCELCNKCSVTCPGKAIPPGPRSEVDGVLRWQIDQEKCYRVWRNIGTDCGVCLSTCPFSQEVDSGSIEAMKDDPQVMKKILEVHQEKYGIRYYNREPMPLIK